MERRPLRVQGCWWLTLLHLPLCVDFGDHLTLLNLTVYVDFLVIIDINYYTLKPVSHVATLPLATFFSNLKSCTGIAEKGRGGKLGGKAKLA